MSTLRTDLLADNPGLAEADEGDLGWFEVTGRAPVPTDDDVAALEMCKSPKPLHFADGRAIGGLYVPPTCTILLAAGDDMARWEMPAGWITKDVHVAPSGERAVVYAKLSGRGVVAEIDFASGDLTVVDIGILGSDKTEFADIWDAGYVGDDDHLAVLLDSGKDAFLAVYVRREAGWVETDNERCNGFSLRTTGQVAVVAREKDCMAFAVVGDQIAKLGKLDKRIRLTEAPADTREAIFGSAVDGSEASVLVGGVAAAANKKPKKAKKGTLRTVRFPSGQAPVHATLDEHVSAFGAGWARDLMTVRGRSAAGRFVATPPGRIVVGEAGESPRTVTTEGSWTFFDVHPSAERALAGGQNGELAVLDLVSGEIGDPIDAGADRQVYTARYVSLPAGDAAIAIERKGVNALELHLEPVTARLGAPAARIDLDTGSAGVAGRDVVITRPGKKKDTQIIERWPVVIDDAGDVSCAFETALVLPGKRYSKTKVMPRTIGGVGVLWSYRKPRFVFAVRPEAPFDG